MDMNLSKLRKIMKDEEAWHAAFHGSQRAGHNLVTEEQLACVFLQEWYFREIKLKATFTFRKNDTAGYFSFLPSEISI